MPKTTTTYKKDDLEIIITHSGEKILYDFVEHEDNEREWEEDLWGPKIESMEVKFTNGKLVNITNMLPKETEEYRGTILIGPADESKSDNYNNDENWIIFGKNLEKKGSLLSILHEIGHAKVNERYPVGVHSMDDKKALKNQVKRERHAWGWALLEFNRLARENMNLEPQMTDRKEVKEFVKESLLSHEIARRAKDLTYGSEPETGRPKDYWRSVTLEYLDELIDKIYEDENFELDENFIPKEELKQNFGIKPGMKK